ncbi:MAG: hypothetical protein CTY16_01515 [Methylobacter sp.]|nr:MAG: hypothetical protein CTY16_01515 [Methylobacter sp.]
MLDRVEIEAKLKEVSKDKCVAFAVRSAMRVLPILALPRKNDLKAKLIVKSSEVFWFWGNDKCFYLLTLFRAYSFDIGFVMDKSSFKYHARYKICSSEAADEADDSYYAADVAFAADAAVDATDLTSDKNYAAHAASYAAEYSYCSARKINFESFIEQAVQNDLRELASLTAQEFLQQPLWTKTISDEWMQLYKAFMEQIETLNMGFDVWLSLYNDLVTGCPIDINKLKFFNNIPQELEAQGVAKVNAQIKNLIQNNGSQPLNRARTIFIGYGEAGKTSLIRALHGEKVVKGKEAMTAGIEVREWPVPDTDIQAHFWDFGGQVVFHSTHKFFLRSSCVYVVVINARADINNSEQAEYWLEHVKVFGGSAPVLIVGNKVDEASVHLQMQTLSQKYPNIKGFYPLSCTHAKTSHRHQFVQFKQALTHELQEVGIHQMLFTPAQANVLEELREYSPDHAFLSEQEFHRICDKHGIINEGELNREWLVDIFDKLGVMLHFDELKAFNDSYMLNPRWLTHGVYTLMNAKQARLNEQDMVSILKAAPVQDEHQHLLSYPPDKCLFISKAMQRFRLCYPLPHGANTLLIPALLCDELPRYPPELHDEQTLRFEFAFNGFLPRNLIGEFMVSRHEEIKNDLQSQRGAVFVSKTLQAEALVEADYHRRLLVMQVYGRDAKDYLMILYDVMIAVFGDLALDYREWVDLPRSALDTNSLERELLKLGNKVEKAEYKQLIETAKDNQAKFISASGLKYDVKKVLGYFLSESEQSRQGITNNFYGANPTVTQNKDQQVSNQTVNISHSTIHGSVLAAEKIENCLNTLQSSPADNDIKQLLTELLKHIAELNSKVPAKVLDPITRDAEDLVNEVNSDNPRKRNSLFSLEGIKDAAIALGETAKPIIEIAEKISPLLQSF